LYEVDAATGTTGAALIDRLAPEQVDVSPDGTHIAFVREKVGHDQLFLADRDGTDIRPLTAADDVGCGCGVHEPDWAPDGTTIAFRGADLAGNQDIYVVDVDSGRVDRITRSSAYEGRRSGRRTGRRSRTHGATAIRQASGWSARGRALGPSG
jgi:Tol biopolymer transport system component